MFDMFTACEQHAAHMREFYDAYVSAGFTPEEAFEMVKIVLANTSRREG
jgi:hypothetical protein